MRIEKMLTSAQIIRKRRLAAETRQGYVSLMIRVLVIAVIGWLLFTQVFFIGQAKGNEMYPAVKDGDLIIGYRLQDTYLEDDAIVYEADGELRVGRIIGRQSDVISMDDSGTLIVNGTVQGGEILFPTYAKEGIEYPYTVPEGCVFVLGDYRTQAEDSRDFGCISLEDVKAKVITILRRREI